MTKNHDRNNFDDSLSHTLQLLKNVTKFENSLSLVVTKVESATLRFGAPIQVSEQSVKNTSAKFLNEHREFLRQKGSNENKIQLIDASLRIDKHNDYPKISIFWRPTILGHLTRLIKWLKLVVIFVHHYLSIRRFLIKGQMILVSRYRHKVQLRLTD